MNPQSRHGHLHKQDFLNGRLVFINQSHNTTVFSPDNAWPHMHIHDFVELSFVVSGSGYHRTLNECVECFPGDVYAINAGAPHAYFIKENGDNLIIQNFVFDPAELLGEELGSPDHPRYCCGLFQKDSMISHVVLSPEYLEEAKRIMDRIGKEQERRQMEWEGAVKAHALDLLIMCSRRTVNKEDVAQKPVPKLRSRQIALTVMCAVMDRYHDPDMTLESIASEAFLSKSHLSYVFRQVTGISFSEYVTNVRMGEACRLLRQTDLTNEEICHACGFRDITSFYRFFQTHAGMTPFAYRRGKALAERNTQIDHQ